MTDAGGDEEEGGSPDGGGDMMVARIAAESGAKEGKKVQLALDAEHVRLFDIETEEAIL